ncbi:hypothetical protein BOW53_02965 [Solemya pervernicosa gill symbiont]|uniref:Uncharacterized protein n=1 Tax=Solemya pervernicosa gill symbiont TaxID=642797 RepID=A0A1T2L972_9GAMM|nr:hypothetical protein [Solemya pervernicosa gill symbiont]OOZ41655.1 hypothetical protein BOW53_02965 [Solemya pervernicosa gill symbiont]
MNISPQLQEALQILGQEPLPGDTAARLEALETAAPQEEADRWGDTWEGFIAAGGHDHEIEAASNDQNTTTA